MDRYLNFPIKTCEFVEVHKVLRHVGGKDEIYDSLSDELVRITTKVLKDVHPVIRRGQLESKSSMVVFEHRDIVVKFGQFAVWVA